MKKYYEVYYTADGYKSSTVVEAVSKEAAIAYVQVHYKNCVQATHAISLN